jgi:iron complex outermembrane recepter protein
MGLVTVPYLMRSSRGPFVRRLRVVPLVIGLLLALDAGAGLAQTPSDTVAHVLRPILVRVPGSAFALGAPRPIATLAGEDVRGARAGVFLEEAINALPGVQIQNRYNFAVGERLAVRGFGGRAQFGVRGVRVLIDGVPATLADGQTTLDHLDVATLGRVEALRGPAASLYGNAAGGVLHFQTRLPPPERVRPEIFTLSGSNGLLQLRGTAAGSAGGVGYLVSAARIEYAGFRTNPLGDDDDTYGAATRNSVNATLHLPGGPGRLRASINWLDLAAENPGSLSQALLDEGDRQAFTNNVRQLTRKDVQQSQLGLSWDGPLGSSRVEVAGYGLLRSVDNPIPSDIIHVDRHAYGGRALLEAPLRLAGVNVAAGGGVELDLQTDDRQNYANAAGSRGPLRLDQLERVRAAGVFGYLRVPLAANADASAGVRYDDFHFRATDRFVSATDPDDSGSRGMSALSPSVGVTIRPADRLELFGTVSTSFETPSTTELANRPEGAGGFNPELEPQRGTTYEAGIRSVLGRGTSLELTAHHTALQDELVPFEVEGVPGRTYYSNAGRSTHRGFEVALGAAGRHGVSARAAYSYLDATFRTYSRGGTSFDGNRIPGIAPHSLDGVARWAPGRWFAELRGLYRGAVTADDANSAEAPAYFLVDLRAGAEPIRAGGFELAPVAGVNNVLDRRYVAAVAVNAFGSRFFEPGPPRSAYVGLRVGGGLR